MQTPFPFASLQYPLFGEELVGNVSMRQLNLTNPFTLTWEQSNHNLLRSISPIAICHNLSYTTWTLFPFNVHINTVVPLYKIWLSSRDGNVTRWKSFLDLRQHLSVWMGITYCELLQNEDTNFGRPPLMFIVVPKGVIGDRKLVHFD